jgi:invasion protein IalB
MKKYLSLPTANTGFSVKPKNRPNFPAVITAILATAAIVWAAPSFATAQTSESDSTEGPSSLQEVYHDWTVTCRKSTPDAAKPTSLCQMNQELRDKNSGQLILSLVVPAKPLPDGANAVLIAPFGLNLSKGVTLSLLEPHLAGTTESATDLAAKVRDPKIHADFRTCLPAGCLANFALSNAMKKALRSGERALVTMMSADQDRAVNVSLSLRGFTAAERRLASLAAEFD